MTNTKALNALADVICRAQAAGRRTPAGIAYAIDSAQMLMSSETATELETLRAERDQLSEDVTGACLARWEEEQESARLRLALKSARRGRRDLRAHIAELEAGKDTREGESTSLGEFISCAGARCSRAEWAGKRAERGWEEMPSGWLCPQCAASAADRKDVLIAAAMRAAEELRAFGTPETVATELAGEHDVRLFLLVTSREEWSTWMTRLDCNPGRTTERGGGLITSHGVWNGVHIAVRCDGVPTRRVGGEGL